MLREATKRRYMLSLRGFVRRFAPEGLLELLPVWLVSPETMAVLFPGEPVFERVIMDEASQCTVAKGFPALLRGHSAVVAGDERQMPLSSFFSLGTSDDAQPEDETTWLDDLSAESLLVLARQRGVHVGLQWHYRCLHEELIAFSNHAMYGGDLRTIPSVATHAAAPALSWVSVPDGAYDRGANPIEADRVAEVIDELLQQHPRPSVGVVTFNIQQRRAVLDAIDRRRAEHEGFARRYEEASTAERIDARPLREEPRVRAGR